MNSAALLRALRGSIGSMSALMILILLLVSISGILSGKASRAQQELEREFARMAPPDGAVLVRYESSHKMRMAAVRSTYTVRYSSGLIVQHYDVALSQQGWLKRERAGETRSKEALERTRFVYCKDPYEAFLEYQGHIVQGIGQYTLVLAWGFGECR